MFGLTKMHELAAARGDGLAPELLDLFEQRQRTIATNIVPLVSRFDQAGSYPAKPFEGKLPEGVVPFRRRTPGAG